MPLDSPAGPLVRSRVSLVIVSLVALNGACGTPKAPPAPAPASADAPAPSSTDSVQAQVRIPGGDSAIAGVPDSVMRTLRADLAARSANTSRAVRADVSPDTLTLEAGARVAFWEALRITAYDSAGAVVNPFSPALELDDRSVAMLERGQIVAIRPGSTPLRVGAVTARQPDGGSTIWRLDSVVVVVVPAKPGT